MGIAAEMSVVGVGRCCGVGRGRRRRWDGREGESGSIGGGGGTLATTRAGSWLCGVGVRLNTRVVDSLDEVVMREGTTRSTALTEATMVQFVIAGQTECE